VRRTWRSVTRAIAVAALPGVLFESAAAAMPDEQCNIHFTAELKPEARDISDGGFLSSLIQNQPAYRLELLRADDTSLVELELTGPGPGYRCENVIETIRKDERVLSIRVDTNAARPASEANWPSSSGKSWGAHLSERGLGAVYWAVHHPEQAWRILAPIQPRDAAADEMLKESAPRDSASRAADRPVG
jgi:hypothetical protein